jgi:PAS domain S-box-containing protein
MTDQTREELLAEVGHLRERLARAEHFRSLLEHGPDALSLLDLTGSAPDLLDARIVGWNVAAERLFGYAAPEILGRVLSALVPTECTAEVGRIMNRLRRGERVVYHDASWVRKDGGRLDVPVSFAPLEDADGQVVGASALARDLSARKHSEAELRDSEGQFRQLVESILQMVWVNLADGTVEYLNPPCSEYFGVPPERMFGWDWRQAVHPDDLAGTLAAVGHTMATGEPLHVEYRLRNRDGRYRWHIGRAVALRDGDGCIAKWFGTAIDIDEQKRAEEALRASGARNRGIAEALPDLLFRQDASGKYLDYYASHPEQLYAPPERFLGRRMEEVLPAEIVPLFREEIRRTLDGQDMRVVEYELEIPGLGRQFFEARMAPSGEGEVVSIVRNVTERGSRQHRAERTFRVFFPALAEAIPALPATQGPSAPPGGSEVVLVVEDEGEVREFTLYLLGRLGYRVLAAGGGAEALRVAEEHPGPIDLLVTDVVMPQMSGRQVAEALRRRRPGLRVLYVSGHTNDARVRHGVEEAEVAFLQKPFTETALAAKVRQVLDENR